MQCLPFKVRIQVNKSRRRKLTLRGRTWSGMSRELYVLWDTGYFV